MKRGNKKNDPKDEDMDVSKNVEQFVALFDYATIGIILTDGKGRIINFNKYAERQFGYSKEEVLGNTIEILLPESVHRKHVALRNGFYQHAENREMGIGRDLYAKNKNGTEFPVEVSLSHYKLNNEEYVIAFVIDITLRKKSQDLVLRQKLELEQISSEMKQLNIDLEQKIQERTLALKETLVELENSKEVLNEAFQKEKELGDLKSRFVSMASHEFRTPLSTILSSTYLMAQYNDAGDRPKREKHIERIVSSVNMLTNILNDFLSLGKIEEGKIQVRFGEFDIQDHLTSIIQEMKNNIKKGQSIRYEHKGATMISLDHSLLKHIVLNLLSNASKFSPVTEVIQLSTTVSDKEVILVVRDRGIGISEEDRVHLFERFFRATNAANIQGTGLGLHIVGKYVELMKGRIECTSEFNNGTVFTITFLKPTVNENNFNY
ncbi:PAS domain-containing sensor histidine kinase [Flavitalea flava]